MPDSLPATTCLLRDEVERCLLAIATPATGAIRYPFLKVNYGQYYHEVLYCWDHFFMGARFLRAGQPEWMRHLVDNLLHYQEEDGYTPSIISAKTGCFDERFPAQPFVAQAAFLYHKATGDDAWLARVWPRLCRYLDFSFKVYATPSGLPVWLETFHSGVDNDAGSFFHPTRRVVTADLPSWLYLETVAMERLAAKVNEPTERFAQRAATLREEVQRLLWNEQAQTFTAWDLEKSRPVLHLDELSEIPQSRYAYFSCTSFLPLFAGLATPEQGSLARRWITDPDHFLSPYGIRSLSRRSPFYHNAIWGGPGRYQKPERLTNSNWQGPIWFPVNYWALHGAARYGGQREALDAARLLLSNMHTQLERHGSFTENYHGETGEPLYAFHMASWNLLADVLEEELAAGRCWVDELLDPAA